MSENNRSIPLPEAFVQRVSNDWPAEADALISALDGAPAVSVLLHPLKSEGQDVFSLSELVPWNKFGRVLRERPLFAEDPLWHAGAYYVQEASSMFLERALEAIRLPENPCVLDLSASPGGKSLVIQNFLKGMGCLVSNEPIAQRNQVLRDNLDRWGYSNVLSTQAFADEFRKSGQQFDLVVVDAPCSGEGMFRKDPRSRTEWSPANVEQCAIRQSEILEDIAEVVRPGGYLIYSTCTFAPAEDEEQVAALIESGDWEICPLELSHGLVHDHRGFGIHFFPHRIEVGEGFYIAVLRKIDGDDSATRQAKGKRPYSAPPKASREILRDWMDIDAFELVQFDDGRLYAHNKETSAMLDALWGKLKITRPGTPIGEFKRTDLIPEHALALSLCSNFQGPTVELDLEECRDFLRCANPDPASFPEKGWTLAQYKGLAVGWAKSLGNRVNNYYPKPLRLLRS